MVRVHGRAPGQVYEDVALATPIATEFLIETVSGGCCAIRVVTGAYGSGADWENEFFAQMVEDTRPIIDKLATYLNARMSRPRPRTVSSSRIGCAGEHP